jgi:predicted PurR-regulated permease PerM
LSATSQGALVIIFTTITSYYLLVEGPALARFGVRMVPLPPRETRALMHEFHEVAVGTLLGMGVIAVVQGTLAGIGYWACGVSKPVVWAALTAGASLLPAIGTGLICVPVALAQMLTGHVSAGVALLIYWQAVVVVIPDYKLRPWLMKGHMRLHELLVLISVFGGIEAFGAVGLLIGPMLVSMFVAMLRIYERDYKPALPEPPPGPLPPKRGDRDRDNNEGGPRLHGRHPQPI